MARISNFIGNPFYRTTFNNGRIFRSTGQSYSANLMSNLSTKNPVLTRKIFSNFINTKTNSTSNAVKNILKDYNKKINEDVNKKISNTQNYTKNSSIAANYYSALGSMFNYLL